MPEETSTRRTALKGLATVALAGTGTASLATNAAGARRDARSDSEQLAAAGPSHRQQPSQLRSVSSGVYDATVDRIVDGEYVVVLVESNGEVVAQYDLARDRYPDLSESQRVRVWIFWGRLLALWTP